MSTVREEIRRILAEEGAEHDTRVLTRVDSLLGANAPTDVPGEPGKVVKRHRLVDVKAAVLQLLQEAQSPMAFGEIRTAPGMVRAADVTVRQALTELRQEGKVSMTGERRTALYQLTTPAAATG